jgi:FkbM family methyltransferase
MRALAALALLCLPLGFIWLIASKRFRGLWKEILSIRSEIQKSRKEIISLRKQLLLLEMNNKLRLPARLPSEDGEEIILYNFFGRKNTGFYIEIGAYNGVDLSNTYFFEAVGWNGLLIEPDPGLYQECLLSRPNSKVINAAASDRPGSLQFTTAIGKEWLSYSGENKSREDRIIAEGGTLNRIEVLCLTLNEILKDSDQEIDFVSLDVEGYELEVLNGFDLAKYRPRVIVIEQSEFDNASPASTILKQHGYSKKFHLGSNSFYTHVSDRGIFSW